MPDIAHAREIMEMFAYHSTLGTDCIIGRTIIGLMRIQLVELTLVYSSS